MEIRVHGIGGPAPESVLGEPRGAGTDCVWQHDRHGASGLRTGLDPSVGVYSWGPLTSGSRWFALWPLALPFTVLNVAGFMHPGPRSKRAVPARLLVHLLAISCTVSLVGWLALAGVLIADRHDRGAVLGAIVGVVAAMVIAATSQLSRRGFESIRPPDVATVGAGRGGGIDDRRFFDRGLAHSRRFVLHLAIVMAAAGFVLRQAGETDELTALRAAAEALVTVTGAAQVVLLLVLVPLTIRRAGWWSLGAVATAGLGVALVGGFVTAILRAVLGPCAPGDPSATCATAGDPFVLVDVYGWALLVALGTTVAIVVWSMIRPLGAESQVQGLRLAPGVPGRLRSRLALVPSRLIGAATAAAVTVVVVGTVAFLARSPETVDRWCTNVRSEASCEWVRDLLPDPRPGPFVATDTAPVRVTHAAFYGILGFMLLNLVKSKASFDALRRVGSIWDVLTFWPRTFHPFAVRPYGERAVPELQHLMARPGQGEIVRVRAHSQGSVLVLAALASLPSDDSLPPVNVLSFGSPIRTLYQRAFPAYVNAELVTSVIQRWPWMNAFRFTDHVGRALFSDDADWTAVEPLVPAHAGYQVSAVGDWAFVDPIPGHAVAGHSHYWFDSRLELTADGP